MLTPPRRLSWRERLSGLLRPNAPRAGFLRDLTTPFFFSWRPPLREPMDEYARAYHEVATRAIDVVQNSGFLAGGIEQATTQIVGSGLALNAKPAPEVFGGDDAGAAEWARNVERSFEAWGRDPYYCDLTEAMSLGKMCYAATRMWFGYGEILALVRHEPKPGQTIGTKLQLLPPTRCPEVSQTPNLLQGVALDRNGTPRAYAINTPSDANQPLTLREVLVPKRDRYGRLIVVHVHDSPPTVVRGITPLAPALLVARQFDQLANATLTAALLQAIFAATIESDAAHTDAVLEALQGEDEQGSTFDTFMSARREWYEGTKIDLGTFGKIIHLFVGEKLNFLRSEHPNENYKPFARFLLLEIAKCLGITYEQLTGDREGATYSSERMGSAENWLLTSARRTHIAGRFMQAAYESWLEESIDIGETPFPGGLDAFIAQKPLACRADWRGPPKPSADDYKTAQANTTKLAGRAITLEQWCAEEGQDWEDVAEQLARENARFEELELQPPHAQPLAPGTTIGPTGEPVPPKVDNEAMKSDGEKEN